LLGGELAQSAPVLVREHRDELGPELAPALQDLFRARASRVVGVALDEPLDDRLVGSTLVPELARQLRLLFVLRC